MTQKIIENSSNENSTSSENNQDKNTEHNNENESVSSNENELLNKSIINNFKKIRELEYIYRYKNVNLQQKNIIKINIIRLKNEVAVLKKK